MSEFVEVAKVGEIPEGRGKLVVVGDREVALFFAGGRHYAMDDCCPHMGESLSVGDVRDGLVICARHLWAFRLADGSCPDVPTLKAETFEVRVQGDRILVRVPD
jgi:nitrite reductase/ring-hydroxylating ferredoxin subunit